MSCLDNLVFIKNDPDAGDVPTYARYIQDLPGITVKAADATMNEEFQSGIDFLKEVIKKAERHVENEFFTAFSPRMQSNSIVDNDNVGYYLDNMNTLNPEGLLKGIHIRMDSYPYATFFLDSVRLQIHTPSTVEIKIIDLIQHKILDTVEITTTTADEIGEVLVGKTYACSNKRLSLLIAYDATSVQSVQSPTYYLKSGCYKCRNGVYTNYAVFFGGAIASNAVYVASNVKPTGHTNGMCISYSLQCSTEPFLCQFRNLLATPLMYRAGAMLMQEMKYSRRLNSVVSLYQAEHEELYEYYDSEATKLLNDLLTGIKTPQDICFQCNARVKHVIQIP